MMTQSGFQNNRPESIMSQQFSKLSLLLVEDDIPTRQELSAFLKKDGHNVTECTNGNQAIACCNSNNYDAIILDLMLPNTNGLQFLKILRKNRSTPVIMISSMTSVDYRLMALESGVDDFLMKPLCEKELLLRIKTILRRHIPNESETIVINDVKINLRMEVIQKNNVAIHLTPTEMKLFSILIKNIGRILSRESLEKAVFGEDRQEYGNMIDQYIMRIRRKLGRHIIKTKIGLGYVIYV